jgi:organic hydroperoxide reductase OsmC/OhrA
MSTYTAKITWKSDSPEAFANNRHTRGHTWEFDGGVKVPASSSPHSVRAPYSVEAAIDPEEALVAAASSCHMLSFLWVASKAGFNVESYVDNAVGQMATTADGKQWISTITLDPRIAWSGNIPTSEDLVHMHHEAHEVCYIANSIKSDVIVKGIE